MKKFKITALVMLICAVCLCGCGSDYAADESTVFVKKDGSVISTDVEDFDSDKYDEDGLKTYIEDELSSYNDENGEDSVKLKRLTVKDGTATLTLTYGTASDYQKFTGNEIFTGSIAEALAAGYSFDDSFASVSDGEITACGDNTEFLNNSGYKVVVFRGNALIQVKGTLAYVTTTNTTYVDSKTVRIEDGTSIFDTGSESGTESATETFATEALSTEEATEVLAEGSVSEDDLLAESTEESEVSFDFSEDTESEEETVSQVYTYIIYK